MTDAQQNAVWDFVNNEAAFSLYTITDWHSSGLRPPQAGSERSSPVQKSNHDVAKPSSSRLRCAIYARKSTEEGLEQEPTSYPVCLLKLFFDV
jgi:hypothetical protein